MTLSRRLLASATGASTFAYSAPVTYPTDYVGLINAASSAAYAYTIGAITSTDGAATFTPGSGALISAGSGGQWDDVHVKDPSLVWDGAQFVCYYSGFDGSAYRIGRATCATLTGSWTKYGSNPVLDLGGGGAFDEDGLSFPAVLYEPADTGAEWKMWYCGFPNGATAGNPQGQLVGYATSSDGLSWTKHGAVLAAGGSGAFDEWGTSMGAVLKIDATYHLLYGGWNTSLKMHSGHASCTDPLGTYTKHGTIAGYTGNLAVGGWTWQSNVPRAVIPRESGTYRVGISTWNPTPVDTEEGCVMVSASDLTTWASPSGLMIGLGSGWYANSAENPSIIVAP